MSSAQNANLKILGLSFFYHDAAAALLIDGRVVAMAEEERFSRKKHDSEFPRLAIDFVLGEAEIAATDLDYVVFYEKPFWKLERTLKTLLATWPATPWVFVKAIKNLFLSKIWIRALIVKELGVAPEKILFSEHHLSHAASAFLCSPYEKSAILTIDGVGEWAVTTIGVGEGNKIKILKEIHFPHSLGLLYSTFTAFLGFEVNEGEYKVMGMAPYGKPKYIAEVKKLVNFYEDGSYSLKLEYFTFYKSAKKMYSRKFLELFGSPRDPKSKFFTRETGWPVYFGEKPAPDKYEKLAEEQEKYANIAASIQAITEEIIINLAKEARRTTGLDKLCIAGGVGLNSCANWKIVQSGIFKDIFIQPASGDAGAALGAALAVYNIVLNNSRRFVLEHAYWGKRYSDEEIKNFLESRQIKYEFIKDDNALFQAISDALIVGKVIGWFGGRFEWGPRALGGRSILADPRRAEMKDIVNTKIKFREPYRPFAPSVLAEHAKDFFDIPEAEKHWPARFMLYVVDVKPEKRKIIPAITHVDGTGRLQTVFRAQNPRYWNLISEFYKKTDVPLLLNTSFNLKGEPIVNTPENAYNTFMKSELDILVLENFLIKK